MQPKPIPTLTRLLELEARYDGPIPAAERRALAFGAPIAADIAETRADVAFFRTMAARTRRAGKCWLRRGDAERAARARADSRLYLSAWRRRRRRLAELERTHAHDIGIAADERRILATIASQIVAPCSDGNVEDRL
jgi:hypothetical protein